MAALNEKQRAFLEAPRFGALSTVDPDGSPHQTVMWYLLDADEIMFNRARERRKPDNLLRDPRVPLLVFDGYEFVRVSGHARETATGEAELVRRWLRDGRLRGEKFARDWLVTDRELQRFRRLEPQRRRRAGGTRAKGGN